MIEAKYAKPFEMELSGIPSAFRVRYIYVASPYSNGDKLKNVIDSIEAGEELIRRGYIPYLPLLTHFWDDISPHDYEFWLDYDLKWLERCEALFRLPGESSGADKEVIYAQERGIPVYYSMEELK